VEESFEVCWNCGTARDGTADPNFQRADESGSAPPDEDDVAESTDISAHITLRRPPEEEAADDVEAARVARQESRPAKHWTRLRCGSTDGIPIRHIMVYGDVGRELSVDVQENPNAMLFKGTHTGVLLASICGRCGHAELYVTNPDELLAAYRKSQQGG
jgi:hypothetical protein